VATTDLNEMLARAVGAAKLHYATAADRTEPAASRYGIIPGGQAGNPAWGQVMSRLSPLSPLFVEKMFQLCYTEQKQQHV